MSTGACERDQRSGCWGNSCASFNKEVTEVQKAASNCRNNPELLSEYLHEVNNTTHNEGYINEDDRALRKQKKANFNAVYNHAWNYDYRAKVTLEDLIGDIRSLRIKAAKQAAKAAGQSRSGIAEAIEAQEKQELQALAQKVGPGIPALQAYIQQHAANDGDILKKLNKYRERVDEWCEKHGLPAIPDLMAFSARAWIENIQKGSPNKQYCIDRVAGGRQQDAARVQRLYEDFEVAMKKNGLFSSVPVAPLVKSEPQYANEDSAVAATQASHGDADATPEETKPSFWQRLRQRSAEGARFQRESSSFKMRGY